MYVDAMIAAGFPICLLFVCVGVLRKGTAAEVGLTAVRAKTILTTLHPFCFWFGPFLFAVGLIQIVYVPRFWQMFPWAMLVSGPVFFGCTYLMRTPDNAYR